MNKGDIMTLICGVGFALHMIYIDRYAKESDPVVLTVLQLGFAALCSWVVAPFLDGGFPQGVFEPQAVKGILYLGLFSTMVGFLLQNVCQKYTSPSTASLLLSMESVFGALFSVLFLKEVLSMRMYAGCVMIFFAVITAETKWDFLKRKKKGIKIHV